jgi:predicted nicotinamide N-methyase
LRVLDLGAQAGVKAVACIVVGFVTMLNRMLARSSFGQLRNNFDQDYASLELCGRKTLKGLSHLPTDTVYKRYLISIFVGCFEVGFSKLNVSGSITFRVSTLIAVLP